MKKNHTRTPARRKSFLRRHPGVLYFFASFLLCVAVLGAGAAYLLHSAFFAAPAQAAVSSEAETFSSAGAASSQPGSADTFNLFTVVLDSGGTPVQFSVVRLDEARQRIAYLVVPANLSVNLGGSKVPLSRYYTVRGLAATRSALYDLTRISLNYTLVLTQKQVVSAVNGLGKIVCTLPATASYTGPDGSKVTVKAGRRTLDGKSAFAVIAAAHVSTLRHYQAQCSLLEAFLSQKVRSVFLDDAKDYFGAYLGKNGSSFDSDTLTSRVDTLKAVTSRSGTYLVNADPDIIPVKSGSLSLSMFGTDSSSVFYQYFDAR